MKIRNIPGTALFSKEKFNTDNEFLEYVRMMVNKEGTPVKSDFVFPDTNFGFSYDKISNDMYRAHFQWNIEGYLLNYEPDEVAGELYLIFKKFAEKIPETIGNI